MQQIESLQEVKRFILELEQQIETLENNIEDIQRHVSDLDKIRSVVIGIAEDEQQRVLSLCEQICSQGLSDVFETPTIVSFEQSITANNPSLELVVTQEGKARDPLTAYGGGLVEVLSLLLRVCFVHIMRSQYMPVLILDEPLGRLSKLRLPLVGEMLNRLSEELSIQIIMVTHHSDMLNFATVSYEAIASEKGTVFIPGGDINE